MGKLRGGQLRTHLTNTVRVSTAINKCSRKGQVNNEYALHSLHDAQPLETAHDIRIHVDKPVTLKSLFATSISDGEFKLASNKMD